MKNYLAFGLVVESDRPLAFPPAEDSTAELIIKACEDLPPIIRPAIHEVLDYPGGPVLRIFGDDEGIDIDYDLWRFSWSRGAGRIAYELGEGTLETEWVLVLERVVLPLYMMTSDPTIIAMHGSAVEIGGKAWVFIGNSGVGKSTTAYELLQRDAGILLTI